MRRPAVGFLLVLPALLLACQGESIVATRDGGPLDAQAPGRECVGDLQCDDRVECTVDRCVAGRCVREPTASRCGQGSACDPERGCLPRRPCVSDTQCTDADPCTVGERCQLPGGYCLFDTLPNDTPCGGNRLCRGGACACPPATPTACGPACVNPDADPDNCGACGMACGAGAYCRDGRCACSKPQTWCPRGGCTDTAIDSANCGACGNACAAPSTCSDGRCLQPCPPMSHRCGDACVRDDSPTTCGTRCAPCPMPSHGRPICLGGGPASACSVTCDMGYHACGTTCASNSDPATCGDRCSPCPPVEHGSVACLDAACRITCETGYHRCGERCASDTAPASCGSRCEPCPSPEHAAAACVAGACDFTCEAGYRRCGDICSDGTSPLGCGPSCTRCRVPEGGVATCTAGACGFRCNAGSHACGDDCRSDVSPMSCGARCEPCPAPANAAATCTAGACGFECNPGYAREGDGCRELPRAVAPPSGSFVTGRRPSFRWTLPPDAPMDSAVEVCRDRECTMVVATLPAMALSARPEADLPAVTLFWRVRAGGVSSPPWRVTVGGRAGGDDAGDRPVAAWGDNPDFDGDGFSDVAVGAPLLGTPAPRVYLYRGTAGGVTPLGRVTLNDPAPAGPGMLPTQFGWSLAAADFTGDGYTDLAVGSPAALGSWGRVYFFRGGPAGLETTARATLDGRDGPNSFFGFAVASAGDLNADGYTDLAVGAYNAGAFGRVYVYYGNGRGPAAAPSVTLDGPSMPGTRFGAAVAGVGDLDGDGDGDLLVGAPEYTAGVGRAFVYRGDRMGLGTTATALVDPFGGRVGSAVAGLGDVNGDGYPDAAVTAPAIDNGTGRVHVYHGGAMGLATPAARSITGPAGMEGDFGTAVVPAGDVDGDGFTDVLASAPRVDTYTGRAYLFRGGAEGVAAMPASNLFDLMAGRALFGGALGGARDIDNDGFSDVVITAERGGMFTGQITVLRGSASGLGRPTVFTGPEGPGNRFGTSVAYIGGTVGRTCGAFLRRFPRTPSEESHAHSMVCRAPRT